MKTIAMADTTLRQKSAQGLSFREKIELVKLLDRLCVDAIELPSIRKVKADTLCIKSIADIARGAAIAVPVERNEESIDTAAAALAKAAKGRLIISAPVSLVTMEYIAHAKPEKIKAETVQVVRYAAERSGEVEFVAEDATRAEKEFLTGFLAEVIEAGATHVTICDDTGTMLPEEFGAFVSDIVSGTENIEKAVLGVRVSNKMGMADAACLAAAVKGAQEIKAAIYSEEYASLPTIVRILSLRGSEYGLTENVRTVELARLSASAARMFEAGRGGTSPFENGVRGDDEVNYFTQHDTKETIIAETVRLGYDLSAEDQEKVFEAFQKVAGRKDQVGSREIDAMVASYALQVPPAYVLGDFIINPGHSIGATAHLRVRKNGELLQSVMLGDGPVDAAFLAAEQIVGKHYELDDFQIRSVTEGREALGEAVVKLRSEGKIYSGRGLSTDIISSSIRAYFNALNKIAYEEETV